MVPCGVNVPYMGYCGGVVRGCVVVVRCVSYLSRVWVARGPGCLGLLSP